MELVNLNSNPISQLNHIVIFTLLTISVISCGGGKSDPPPIKDVDAPVIFLNGNSPMSVEIGTTFTDPGAYVVDNVDVGLEATITGNVNTSTLGTYSLMYSAIDSSGNVAILVTRTVRVTDANGAINRWTWISGSNTSAQSGIYGTKGVADAANVPGGRGYFASWTDSKNNLWLFGGSGYDSLGNAGRLNDLWKFDGVNWTWVSGSTIRGQLGVYGNKGTIDDLNVPGSRLGSVTWIDNEDNLWLFGGYGSDSTGSTGQFNDLWMFNGVNWVWISGSNQLNQLGVYGSRGVSNSNNSPGGRYYSVSWIDGSNNLWLFGGGGYDRSGFTGTLNDLWKFDGDNWTWVSGSSVGTQISIYGTKGIASSSNVPSSRHSSTSWIDSEGNLWLFGGIGYATTLVNSGDLNDLWKFDGTNWTWISGSNDIEQLGVYGSKGVADSLNVPGSRHGSISWTDENDNLWLFGGSGYITSGAWGPFNDLWKFNGISWTWVSGLNDFVSYPGLYGTQGISASVNKPGGKRYSNKWLDKNNNLWLLGGDDMKNDLWRYEP